MKEQPYRNVILRGSKLPPYMVLFRMTAGFCSRNSGATPPGAALGARRGQNPLDIAAITSRITIRRLDPIASFVDARGFSVQFKRARTVLYMRTR